LKHLAGLEILEDLCLDGTKVSDKGLVHVAGLTRLHKLHIRTRGTITDAGLDSLTELTELQELLLTGTKVTKSGTEKLRKALPRCKIE